MREGGKERKREKTERGREKETMKIDINTQEYMGDDSRSTL